MNNIIIAPLSDEDDEDDYNRNRIMMAADQEDIHMVIHAVEYPVSDDDDDDDDNDGDEDEDMDDDEDDDMDEEDDEDDDEDDDDEDDDDEDDDSVEDSFVVIEKKENDIDFFVKWRAKSQITTVTSLVFHSVMTINTTSCAILPPHGDQDV
jgi:hypothetical protein